MDTTSLSLTLITSQCLKCNARASRPFAATMQRVLLYGVTFIDARDIFAQP